MTPRCAHSCRLSPRYEQSIGPTALQRPCLRPVKVLVQTGVAPLETNPVGLDLEWSLSIDDPEAAIVLVTGLCGY